MEGQSEKDRKNRGPLAGAVSGAIKRNSFDRLSRGE